MRNPEHKQYSPFTLPPELAERFDQYVTAKGISRNAAIGNLLEVGLLSDAQTVLPERAGDIEDFLTHQQAQAELFRKALECIKTADDRARAGVSCQLDTLAATVDENKRLRADNDNLQAQCHTLQEQLRALGDAEQIKQEREELTTLRLRVAELQNEIAEKNMTFSQRLEEERNRVFSVLEMLTNQNNQNKQE